MKPPGGSQRQASGWHRRLRQTAWRNGERGSRQRALSLPSARKAGGVKGAEKPAATSCVGKMAKRRNGERNKRRKKSWRRQKYRKRGGSLNGEMWRPVAAGSPGLQRSLAAVGISGGVALGSCNAHHRGNGVIRLAALAAISSSILY